MSVIEFTYGDYETTRFELIETVKSRLTENGKTFLLSLNRIASNWSIYDYQRFPSVSWKLLNLEKFKKEDPERYQKQHVELETILAH